MKSFEAFLINIPMMFAYALLLFCLSSHKETVSEMLPRKVNLTLNYLTTYNLWDGAFHSVSVVMKRSLMADIHHLKRVFLREHKRLT